MLTHALVNIQALTRIQSTITWERCQRRVVYFSNSLTLVNPLIRWYQLYFRVFWPCIITYHHSTETS